MNEKPLSRQSSYQITVAGHLDGRWADLFDGMTIEYRRQNGDKTVLTVSIADQAALRGLLNQIWDFNLTILAVERTNEA